MKSLLLASVATALLTLAPGHEYEPSRCRNAAFPSSLHGPRGCTGPCRPGAGGVTSDLSLTGPVSTARASSGGRLGAQ